MIHYYSQVAPMLVPHLRARGLTLKRFPDGVYEWHWFQTECPHPPPWLPTHAIRSRARRDKVFNYCGVDSLASLVWIANLGAIEIHPLLHTTEEPPRPTVVVFDLDPGPPADIIDCCDIALTLHTLLDERGLHAVVKTSGSLGLHVYAPVTADFEKSRALAEELTRVLRTEHPDKVVDTIARAERTGKVFVDVRNNRPVASMVAPYSLRGLAIPTVSTPLSWPEVEDARARREAHALVFTPSEVIERIEEHGDLFAPALASGPPLA